MPWGSLFTSTSSPLLYNYNIIVLSNCWGTNNLFNSILSGEWNSPSYLHCPLFSQHWNYWKPVKPKKSVTTWSGNSQHFQTLANFWSRACIFHRVFVRFSLQSCWDEAGRMRDERGKKLEVLISSSSQVKILLTMDDRRGEKKTKGARAFEF